MLFSSVEFLFYFLPIVMGIVLLCPRRAQNIVILVASLWFYWTGERMGVLLLVVSILWNWIFGLLLGDRPRGLGDRLILTLGIVGNLSLLFWFKYMNFAAANVLPILARFGYEAPKLAPIALPIGISFFTFQAMSYIIDVFRGHVKVQRNVLDFGMYKALFPQLIAGPIVRYRDVAAEVTSRSIGLRKSAEGARRFVIGLGKKMLIANGAALAADRIFAIPAADLHASVAWLGILSYTVQIYFDFSGYSDMAIGMGRMLGFTFLENFDHPYAARSITEFWRRWHISLSSWFRDYLYIPLGGNRAGPLRTYVNLVIVFLLCGLWHGANWTFVVWGLYHGALLVIERAGFGRTLERLPVIARHAIAIVLVMVGWVFFRAEDLTHALRYLLAMSGFGGATSVVHAFPVYATRTAGLTLLLGAIGAVPWWKAMTAALDRTERRIPAFGAALLTILREAVGLAYMGGVFFLSAAWLASNTHNPFIYFRF